MTTEPQTQSQEEGFDPAERVLCADEACIGLVGEGGRCKVCGKPGGPAPAEAQGVAPGTAGDEVGGVAVIDETEHLEEAGDFDERRLCPDDSCIGVLGPDGRCKVCGREGPGATP